MKHTSGRASAAVGTGRGRRALLAGLALCAAAALAEAAPQQRGEPLRYVLAGEDGVKLRNIGDPKGLELAQLPAGTPLAVHKEQGAWLRVEVPGGYRAWIFGRYLTPTGVQDWFSVSGSPVMLRPLPDSSNKSYPIDSAYAGDQVRMIERDDPKKPLSDDWVEIWSPPGTTAWALAAETTQPPAGADGKALFATALDGALAQRSSAKSNVQAAPASAPRGESAAAATDAFAAFEAAEQKLEALPEGATLEQLTEVRAAYEAVLALSPDAPTRNLVDSRLELLGLREELARMRVDIAEDRTRSQQRRAELERMIEDANKRKDPLRGRFVARGWVVEEPGPDGKPTFLVRWAGGTRGQIVCSSGRYDLSRFKSFEVGVHGYSVPQTSGDVPSRIDVRKLEVISGRPADAR